MSPQRPETPTNLAQNDNSDLVEQNQHQHPLNKNNNNIAAAAPPRSILGSFFYSALLLTFWVLGFLLAFYAPSPLDRIELVAESPWMNAITFYRDLGQWTINHVTAANMFFVQSAVTCCALFWLLHRAWLTLWKPVAELISILGVEVPDSPEVFLAGIKADAVTLHWTRPGANKPVLKYLIQVNGVNVGESSRTETAITVTGLKPSHFYNVRVIAVGHNNFQAGSKVIRLRTYGRDGRPQTDSGRIPSNLAIGDQQSTTLVESSDESPAVRAHAAGIEAAAVAESSQPAARETSSTHSSQRRNTGGRKHSPSNPAVDHVALANVSKNRADESMQQLTEKFEAIRRETEDVMSQVAKDTEEFKVQILDLARDRDEKRQALKEKEEASEKLKKEVNYSERANRQAQNRKSQKDKVLKDKQTERAKMQADMTRWRKEIEAMKIEREEWQKEKKNLTNAKESRADELRGIIRKRQNSLNGLEEEIRIKGLKIKELEEERKNLPGAEDDDESRERDAVDKQRDLEWEKTERSLALSLNAQQLHLRQLQAEYQNAQATLSAISARQANNQLMYHGNSSGVDFDPSGQGKAKSRRSRNRKSRTSTISSPVAGYQITDSPFPSASAYNNLTNPAPLNFAPGPYFDLNHDTAMVPLSEQISGMSEADVRALTMGAPLSPTATSLLPSNIFADDDPPSPRAGSTRSFGPALYHNIGQTAHDTDPQSPGSSSRSASRMSSPQASSQNLARYGVSGQDHATENKGRFFASPRAEFGIIGSPSGSNAVPTHKGLSNIFTFPKSRAKTTSQDSPALGSLKTGQSQSFPRSIDEPEATANRQRRVSFTSGWNVMPSFFTRSATVNDSTDSNAPAPTRNPASRRRRGLNMFASSIDDPIAFSDRDPSSPRPVSIASSDFPRPSTDSAPFGWPAAEGNAINRNSPLAANWSVNVANFWSRNPSRRPSTQYGSSTALASGIASDDDEFLPPDTNIGQASPPPVGVIGTRPASSQKPVTPKLNPAAPTFRAMFSRPNKAEKDKGKGKEKATDPSASPEETTQQTSASSPSESRKSRDTHSVHTQNSVAESSESLERIISDTPSELMNPGAPGSKDKESSFTRLLRKGSSSKFSLSSIRGKDAGLFSSKKGTSSAANSDRAERDSSIDFGEDAGLVRSFDSVTSSPMIGSLGSGEWKGKERDPGTPKEGRMSVNWGRAFGRKKGKGRESLDVDRSEAEMTGTEDEDA
ncbi:Uncharacterized protein BP5553_08438 [Venustampulla echinocandica]|uniref:Fibronectin type-III domain-containing protein n=1 Tax=Venustampulla echinocandica TaxID=2656787 RepID=A0A370TE75_9HELO|nr:Uncharacterized protein BP5553_08438 [Venustampulla echinocandica]RDL32999.1 Uncharacterized protein BP5553_08438 [Venustampulla echinocandica]